MESFVIPELKVYAELLRSCAPGQQGFGDLSELLKKIPFWMIVWGVDLQIDQKAKPPFSKPVSGKLRKWLKGNRKTIAQLGPVFVKHFGNCPPLEIPDDRPLDSDGRDKILATVLRFRDLGRRGFRPSYSSDYC